MLFFKAAKHIQSHISKNKLSSRTGGELVARKKEGANLQICLVHDIIN